jgi:hypothetical protein
MLARGDPVTGDEEQFQVVGTIGERGSLVMLGVSPDPSSPNVRALIGLLFTGALSSPAVLPGPPQALGRYTTAGFGVLLPAAQLPAIQLPAIQRNAVLSIAIASPPG